VEKGPFRENRKRTSDSPPKKPWKVKGNGQVESLGRGGKTQNAWGKVLTKENRYSKSSHQTIHVERLKTSNTGRREEKACEVNSMRP